MGRPLLVNVLCFNSLCLGVAGLMARKDHDEITNFNN